MFSGGSGQLGLAVGIAIYGLLVYFFIFFFILLFLVILFDITYKFGSIGFIIGVLLIFGSFRLFFLLRDLPRK